MTDHYGENLIKFLKVLTKHAAAQNRLTLMAEAEVCGNGRVIWKWKSLQAFFCDSLPR